MQDLIDDTVSLSSIDPACPFSKTSEIVPLWVLIQPDIQAKKGARARASGTGGSGMQVPIVCSNELSAVALIFVAYCWCGVLKTPTGW